MRWYGLVIQNIGEPQIPQREPGEQVPAGRASSDVGAEAEVALGAVGLDAVERGRVDQRLVVAVVALLVGLAAMVDDAASVPGVRDVVLDGAPCPRIAAAGR